MSSYSYYYDLSNNIFTYYGLDVSSYSVSYTISGYVRPTISTSGYIDYVPPSGYSTGSNLSLSGLFSGFGAYYDLSFNSISGFTMTSYTTSFDYLTSSSYIDPFSYYSYLLSSYSISGYTYTGIVNAFSTNAIVCKSVTISGILPPTPTYNYYLNGTDTAGLTLGSETTYSSTPDYITPFGISSYYLVCSGSNGIPTGKGLSLTGITPLSLPNNGFTINFTFKTGEASYNPKRLFEFYNSTSSYFFVGLYSGYLMLGIDNNIVPQVYGTLINDNVWRNVTVVVKPSDTSGSNIDLYINKDLVTSNLSMLSYPSLSYSNVYICQSDGGTIKLAQIDPFSFSDGTNYVSNGSLQNDSFGTNTQKLGLPGGWGSTATAKLQYKLYKAQGASAFYSGTLPTGLTKYIVMQVYDDVRTGTLDVKQTINLVGGTSYTISFYAWSRDTLYDPFSVSFGSTLVDGNITLTQSPNLYSYSVYAPSNTPVLMFRTTHNSTGDYSTFITGVSITENPTSYGGFVGSFYNFKLFNSILSSSDIALVSTDPPFLNVNGKSQFNTVNCNSLFVNGVSLGSSNGVIDNVARSLAYSISGSVNTLSNNLYNNALDHQSLWATLYGISGVVDYHNYQIGAMNNTISTIQSSTGVDILSRQLVYGISGVVNNHTYQIGAMNSTISTIQSSTGVDILARQLIYGISGVVNNHTYQIGSINNSVVNYNLAINSISGLLVINNNQISALQNVTAGQTYSGGTTSFTNNISSTNNILATGYFKSTTNSSGQGGFLFDNSQYIALNASSGVDGNAGFPNGVSHGTGDGCSDTTFNVALRTWQGVGMVNTSNDGHSGNGRVQHYWDARNGGYTAKGTITANNLVSNNNITATATITGNSIVSNNGITATGTITGNNIVSNGNISASSGSISCVNFTSTNLISAKTINSSENINATSGSVSAINMYASNAVEAHKLLVVESTGSSGDCNGGTVTLQHNNSTGGVSSIVFRSCTNSDSDYGYIRYRDNIDNTAGERSRLEIGTENDNRTTLGSNEDMLTLQKSGGCTNIMGPLFCPYMCPGAYMIVEKAPTSYSNSVGGYSFTVLGTRIDLGSRGFDGMITPYIGCVMPIFCTCDFGTFQCNDRDTGFITMPGYKLIVYKDGLDSQSMTFDNTYGTTIMVGSSNEPRSATTCRLYFANNEINTGINNVGGNSYA